MSGMQLFLYCAFAIFLAGNVRVVVRYLSMPLHLRWELYPVAHEKGRGYGGSYLEDVDWWKKTRKKSLTHELKFMVPEILFIRALYHHNRKLWIVSFPFHAGLYLLVVFLVFMIIGAIGQGLGMEITATNSGFFSRLVFYAIAVTGSVGLISALLGCSGLFVLRVMDDELRRNSVPIDFAHLILIMCVLVSACVTWLSADQSFSAARTYVTGLITFEPVKVPAAWFGIQMVLTGVFFMYFPFSHMTHMFTKYFTYHRVRWDDEPNVKGSKMEARVRALLDRPIRWSAPHIPTGKRWKDIVEEQTDGNKEGNSSRYK